MRGGRDQAGTFARYDPTFWPMHAISADAPRQLRIRGNEKRKSARPAYAGKLTRDVRAIRRAKMAINYACSARQPFDGGDGIRRPLRVGEEKQRWNRRAARIAVEPARQRG